jgi:hypothetical protein
VSVPEWEQWIVRLLISGGILNVLREETIKEHAGRHYDINMDYAFKSLMDKGIITQLQSERDRRYMLNWEKLDEAHDIMRKEVPKEEATQAAQPYIPEPEGYAFWFDPEERRTFRKQSMYRLFRKKDGSRDYVGQVLSKSMRVPVNYYTGSLDEPDSHISVLVRSMNVLAREHADHTFNLQDLQDKERLACGNNRQRGKVILLVCERLGIIEFAGMKGNSASYRMAGTAPPPPTTLDDFGSRGDGPDMDFDDPEQFDDTQESDVHPTVRDNVRDDETSESGGEL